MPEKKQSDTMADKKQDKKQPMDGFRHFIGAILNILSTVIGKAYVIIPVWWTLPLFTSLIYLALTRTQLEKNNLHDTYLSGEFPQSPVDCTDMTAARTLSGVCNNLEKPGMGATGTRFHRFVPIQTTWGETNTLYKPNPRTVSQEFLKRTTFTPATSINLLAAVWIQFQTHDWFSHGLVNDPENPMVFDLPENDPLRAAGQTTMTVQRTANKETHNGRPDTFKNINTHWWDLDPIYGSNEKTHATVRSYIDGKLKVAEDGLLPVGADGIDITGFNDNWWAGLSMLHNIWTKEHNLVCDMFKKSHPEWNDQTIFDHARLVTTAINAKVHTVEWTPALLQTKTLERGMNANWNGLLSHWITLPHFFKRALQRLVPQKISQALFGIVGGRPHFANVDFAHSEEFVSIYRFHSLLPDTLTIRDGATGKQRTEKTYDLAQYSFRGAQDIIRGNKFSDVVYTFGVDHPGAMAPNNFPAALMNLDKPGQADVLDMGVIDILRDRERGVPRYSEFRRLFSLVSPKTIEDISDDPEVVALLHSIYGNEVENVDLLAGSLAESPLPDGFAFSNTQFQAFILAASRRLQTDRFFTEDYKAATYTQEGLDYIHDSDFRKVIARTVPELREVVMSVDNAFKPWVLPLPS
ncbi:heme peroxidase family protein [Mycena galopus ATCC 62051]|nr:heme peroxidase family protein [Mycena galopus ATCC 62051]